MKETGTAVPSSKRKTKLRELSKSCCCLLLLAPILNLSGCDLVKQFFTGGGSKSKPATQKVSVDKYCGLGSSPDPVKVHPGDTVEWDFPDNSFEITFDAKYDLHSSNPTLNIAPGPFPASSKTAQWVTASSTPVDCSIVILSDGKPHNAGCYFKYNINYVTVTGGITTLSVCNDPGVLVQPD